MKNFILSLALILSIATISFASEDAGKSNVVGAKLDAPDLIKFSKDVSIGVEAQKDFAQYINDRWAHTDGDRGYSGYIKATVKWSILDFSK